MGLDTMGVDTAALDMAGLDSVGLDSVGLDSAGLGFEIFHKHFVADPSSIQIFLQIDNESCKRDLRRCGQVILAKLSLKIGKI